MLNTSYRVASNSALDLTANAARPRAGHAGKSFRSSALAAMADYSAGRGTATPATSSKTRQVSAAALTTRQNSVTSQAAKPAAQNGTATSPNVPSWAIPGPLMGVANAVANAATATTANVQNSATQPSAAAQSSAPQAATAQPLTGDAATLQGLEDALISAGIDYSSLGLATHQDVVTYPGGSYTNRYISVSANGHDSELMTDLVNISPKVAVGDIERMLGRAVVG
jgi:hypothetical protein